MKKRKATILKLLLIITLLLLPLHCYAETDQAFKEQVKKSLAACQWLPITRGYGVLRPKVLKEAIKLGEEFMLQNQLAKGNFAYEYNWGTKKDNPDDSAVRQGGALWGMALFYLYEPKEKTRAAIEKCFDFILQNTKPLSHGRLVIDYPGSRQVKTGCVALYALGLIEYLRAGGPKSAERKKLMEKTLDGYLEFLASQQMDNDHFSSGYLLAPKNRKIMASSPYFHGETLLWRLKANTYLNRKKYRPVIEKGIFACAKTYTFAWQRDGKPNRTKGFYQWGTMSFYEYGLTNWQDAALYRDIALFLAHWMIYHHETLRRTRNTAYAHEGLVHAYLLARQKTDQKAAQAIKEVIHRGLHKLMRWQVGGPLRKLNKYLLDGGMKDKRALGGFQNHRKEKGLRIDVTQHQGHAMLLALKHLFPASAKKSSPPKK